MKLFLASKIVMLLVNTFKNSVEFECEIKMTSFS